VLGDTLGGRYLLSGLLGAGGMAEVFLAHDRMLDRDLALKVLMEHYAKDERFVGRFWREAQSAARACSSRCTDRRPTSRGRGSPTPSARSRAPR
jgi:hypothetical protein